VDEPLTRVSALGSDWFLGSGLSVIGDGRGDDRGGCSFGVSRTGEASRAEK